MEKERQIALITAIQNGESDAANEFFAEIYNDVYYFAYKTVKDENLAADITQETLIEVYSKIGELRDPVAFPAWCRQITFFQCTRYFRKKKDVVLSEDEEGGSLFDTLEEESAEFIPDEALDRKGFKKIILDLIDTLSEEQRSAVMMYYFDELSISQIAEIQGVSEGTVKSRLNYARKAIKERVEEFEKKNDIKLHAIGFFPFFKWLFSGEKAGMAASPAALESAAAAVSGGSAAAAAAATTGAATAAAGVGIGVKIAAACLAGALALGAAVSLPKVVSVNGQKVSVIEAVFGSSSAKIPSGGTYYTKNPETYEEIVLKGGDKFPEPQEGDAYEFGDYNYTYSLNRMHLMGGRDCDALGWNAKVVDDNLEEYGPLLEKIGDTPVTCLSGTFHNCDKMKYAPEIPKGITCMYGTFMSCSSLIQSPEIPNGVIDMNSTYIDCSSLEEFPHIPSSVLYLDGTFSRSFLSGGSKLHGKEIVIDANPEEYSQCFFQIKNVTVKGKTKMKEELEKTSSGGILLY